MIQDLTIKQLDEISLEDKARFNHYPVSIGDLWQALEKEIECIFFRKENGTWVVELNDRASIPKQFENKEPIYALWEAYKFYIKEYD